MENSHEYKRLEELTFFFFGSIILLIVPLVESVISNFYLKLVFVLLFLTVSFFLRRLINYKNFSKLIALLKIRIWHLYIINIVLYIVLSMVFHK